MKEFGDFREFGYGSPKALSIYDYISNEPFINQDRVVNYLKSGNFIIACGAIERDILSKDEKYAGNPSIKTDGEWIWRGDLPYYVETYNLKPPDEMLLHMEKNNWKVPELSDEEIMNLSIELEQNITSQ